MKVITLILGACNTNCYIVYDEITRECMIIDPADEAVKIIEAVEDNGLLPRYLFITHGHTDHILAANEVETRYKIPVIISKEDAWRLADEELINERPYVIEPYKPVRPSILLQEGDEIWLGDMRFTTFNMPGHTPGSMALINDHAIFTGDTLLKNNHGKTTLPGGDEKQLIRSIKRMAGLSGDYIIYPGHREITTLEEERKNNPYLI